MDFIFFALISVCFWRTRLLGALVGGATVLILLVVPVAGITSWAWLHLPQAIQRITYYWPMQRFYLLLAGLLAITAQVSFGHFTSRWIRISGWTIFLMASWSLWEARHFVEAATSRTASVETSERAQRPENLLLMNHAYGLFAALPGYFSNGVMDPAFENRLVDRTTFRPISTVATSEPPETWLHGAVDLNPGVIKFVPSFFLAAGREYELRLDFAAENYSGVLQLTGRDLFREYRLPRSGESLAFGSGSANSKTLPLRTTSESGDEIILRFIPSHGVPDPGAFLRFAKYFFNEVRPMLAGVEINSLLPLEVTTRAPSVAWLETSRMYQPGYRATVDGRTVEVQRSPQLLVMIPVEAGTHEVELRYIGPPLLRISYWLTLVAWSGLFGSVVWTVRKNSQRTAAYV